MTPHEHERAPALPLGLIEGIAFGGAAGWLAAPSVVHFSLAAVLLASGLGGGVCGALVGWSSARRAHRGLSRA